MWLIQFDDLTEQVADILTQNRTKMVKNLEKQNKQTKTIRYRSVQNYKLFGGVKRPGSITVRTRLQQDVGIRCSDVGVQLTLFRKLCPQRCYVGL